MFLQGMKTASAQDTNPCNLIPIFSKTFCRQEPPIFFHVRHSIAKKQNKI